MKSVGIIGFGVFGEFMARQLTPYFEVMVSSRRVRTEVVAQTGAQLVSLQEAASADVVIPCVPVQHLASVLTQLAGYVSPGALVVDVASVKTVPVELMLQILPPGVDILATHPLFGPQSGANGIQGLPMVVWPVRLSDERLGDVTRFLTDKLQLDVQAVSPEEHDREMAYVQALTFLLGRAFSEIDIPDTPLKTKTYQHLLDVRRIVENDTPELFETIQLFNPYAGEMRRRLVMKLDDIEAELEK